MDKVNGWGKKYTAVVVLLLILLLFCFSPVASIVLADSSDTITVTAVGFIEGAPGGLTLTYVSDYEVGISWIKGEPIEPFPEGTESTAVNTLVRVRWGEIPADRTDGYQVYYGDGNSYSDTATDLTSLTSTPYYRVWSETVYYDINGNILSNIWEEIGIWEEANFMSISWLFMGLLLAAVILVVAMFHSRNVMLGFPSAIFWFVFGGYNYTLSATTWDIHYLIFFASMGMGIFCLFAMYALQAKDLSGPDADRGKFFDEGREPDLRGDIERSSTERGSAERSSTESGDEFDDEFQPSSRVKALRERAARRRSSSVKKKTDWGEFRR